jgi:hypothetical protein
MDESSTTISWQAMIMVKIIRLVLVIIIILSRVDQVDD